MNLGSRGGVRSTVKSLGAASTRIPKAPACIGEGELVTALIAQVHELVEVPNWAPWLRFSLDELRTYSAVFPRGQFVDLGGDGRPVGALTTTRMTWRGDPEDLTSWDAVSGHDSGVGEAFDAEGNTLVLLSMSVRPDARGRGPSLGLIEQARQLARREGMDHLIGPFRPNGYGPHKASGATAGFRDWCLTRRPDGHPADPWLRAMDRIGMRPLKIAPRAMVVEEPMAVWEEYRSTYRPEAWFPPTEDIAVRLRADALLADRPDLEVWECEETGSWFLDREAGTAMYVEANLWGELPLGPTEDDA